MLARFIIVAFVLAGGGCSSYLALTEYQGRLYIATEDRVVGGGRLLECRRAADDKALDCRFVDVLLPDAPPSVREDTREDSIPWRF